MSGWNIPPKSNQPTLPDWMDPEVALRQRDKPHVSYTLVTRDAGESWTSTNVSALGTIVRVRLNPEGGGLGLTAYPASSSFPSEVFTIDWVTGKSGIVYRDAKFAVSDVWLASDGTAYLAGVVSEGRLRGMVPGRVQVLRSKDYANWTPTQVDYRAEATGAILAASGDGNLWLATDTGMILKLIP
jgi:hypothetical protein